MERYVHERRRERSASIIQGKKVREGQRIGTGADLNVSLAWLFGTWKERAVLPANRVSGENHQRYLKSIPAC